MRPGRGAAPSSDPWARGSVFTRYALRSLAANRVRTGVTVVGIALATGLLMAVLASATSLQAGLANQSRESGGVWQLSLPQLRPGELDLLRESAGDRLDRLAVQRDLGAAPFSATDAAQYGTYLAVLTLPQEEDGLPRARGDEAHPVTREPVVSSGRLPKRDGEIALTSSLSGASLSPGASELPGVEAGVLSETPLDLGSELTLSLGRRVAGEKDGGARTVASDDLVSYGGPGAEDGPTAASDAGPGAPDESLEGVSDPRTYTVVGFVEPDWSTPGLCAYVSPTATGGAAEPRTSVFFSTSCATRGELDALADAVRPDGDVVANEFLLVYEGLGQGRRGPDSITLLVSVLVGTIVVAAVSLISNAFTISVSERTRQFGLLSSLGASRRQLRRVVLAEAAVLGAVGVPLGVGLGLAGSGAAFALTGAGWAAIVGTQSAITLVVRPWCVGLTVLLASVTLVVSAWVPAARAGRVSAVEAIRQTRDVCPDRRLRRAFRRRAGAAGGLALDLPRPRGLAARVGGMPAFLAQRTLRTSAGKGRAAVLALAVSAAMLVTAGVVSEMASGYISLGSGGLPRFDLMVQVENTDPAPPMAEGLKTPPASLARADGTLARVRRIEGVTRAAYVADGSADARLSEGLLPKGAARGLDPFAGSGLNVLSGGFAHARVYLVDDASWRALADAGVISGEAASPERLSGVLLGSLNTTEGERTATRNLLPSGTTGTVELLVPRERAGFEEPVIAWDGSNELGVFYTPAGQWDAEPLRVPADEATEVTASVPVTVALRLPTELPVSVRQMRDSFPSLVMPARAARRAGVLRTLTYGYRSLVLSHYANVAPGHDAARALREMAGAVGGPGTEAVGSTNIAAAERDARAMAFALQVFLLSFAAIMALISVANVFNTIASSLMLRTREFAALRSAGMGERGLGRMVLAECASYALRGLLLGGALSLVVKVLLDWARSAPESGLAMAVPWGHLALAFAVVVAVLAASALYAVRRTRAMNLVEALRADAL